MKRLASFAALNVNSTLPVLTLARSGLYYDAKRIKICCSICQKEYETTSTDFCFHTAQSSFSNQTLQNSVSLLATENAKGFRLLKDVANSCIGRMSRNQVQVPLSDGRFSGPSNTINLPEEPFLSLAFLNAPKDVVHSVPSQNTQQILDLSKLLPLPTDENQLMEHYRLRLQSYLGSPTRTRGPTKEALAWYGFKYCGPNDKVRCTYCNGNLRDWEDGDEALEEHKRWNPHCSFLPIVTSYSIPSEVQMKRYLENKLPSITIGAEQYRIDPREIKARMDGTSARTIIDMGYAPELVRTVIAEKLRNTGDDFSSVTEMLEAVFQKAEETKASGPMGASNWVPNLNIPSVVPSTLDAVLDSSNKEILKHPDDDFQPTGKKKKKKKSKKLSLDINSNASNIELPNVSSNLPDDEYLKLKAENEELKSMRTCKVCMEREVNTVALPCGHLVTCDVCVSKIHNCCMCRTFIRGTVKTYLS